MWFSLSSMVQPLHIQNAHVWDGHGVERRDPYTSDVILDKPANGALKVDLEGYTIFPGLINAHDHLELNHYPRSKFREKYDNARQWHEDMNARLDSEPYKSLRAYPLEDRLFIGGLKNLLCGAMTVAHHNPPHKALFRKDFPVRVLQKYGWAHSFYLDSEAAIKSSHEKTPGDAPWFIHLAEGTDEAAAGEYQRLKAMGCVDHKTAIVHGVGFRPEDVREAIEMVGQMVWCPSTNKYLLGNTADIVMWDSRLTYVMLGSDSRLTADGDLLDELRAAMNTGLINDERVLIEMVLANPAQSITDVHTGHLAPDAYADWIAYDESEYLIGLQRADLALVVKGGVPQIGDPDVMAKFPHIPTVSAILDGVPKAIHSDLARRIHQCTLKEPGLEVDALPTRKFWTWKRA
jgi:cytosine/adenosine deaminase-related metal-dependent hydrolase